MLYPDYLRSAVRLAQISRLFASLAYVVGAGGLHSKTLLQLYGLSSKLVAVRAFVLTLLRTLVLLVQFDVLLKVQLTRALQRIDLRITRPEHWRSNFWLSLQTPLVLRIGRAELGVAVSESHAVAVLLMRVRFFGHAVDGLLLLVVELLAICDWLLLECSC